MGKKDSVERTVTNLVQEVLRPTPYDLYDVEAGKEGGDYILRIFIDSETGIDLNDCEEVTHLLNDPLDKLDPINGPYLLEISSPGVERRLKTASHFEKVLGKQIHLKCYKPVAGHREHTATLTAVTPTTITISSQDATAEIAFDNIAKANLSVF